MNFLTNEDIIDLIPKDRKVIYRDSPGVVKCIQLDEKEFIALKFEFIKHIRKSERPEDRVADFEFHDDRNIPDFDKMERLIEKRKTREERENEQRERWEFEKELRKAREDGLC